MFKKLIAGIVITMMLVVQLTGTVFAASDDVKAALTELQSLGDNEKKAILYSLWVNGVAEIADNDAVTVSGVYSSIEASMGGQWSVIVDTNNDGLPANTIKASSLEILIQKLINNKETISNYYQIIKNYATKAEVRNFLGLDPGVTEAELTAAMLPYKVEILQLSGSQFIRYGNVASSLSEKLVANTEYADLQAVFTILLADVNDMVDDLAVRLNTNMATYGVSTTDIIYFLEIYDLYHAPSTVVAATPTPESTATPEPTAAPTPAPTEEPTATIPPEAVEIVGNINDTTNNINNETDPNTALDMAVELINNTIAEVEDLADQGISTQAVTEALETAADTALAKVNTQTVAATVSEGTSTAIIDTAEADELIAMLDVIAATTEELNTGLALVSSDARIESVLNINVEVTDTAMTASSAQLPVSLLTAATGLAIDRIAVDTGIAIISITPDAITTSGETTVTLSAAKVNTDTLSDEQKATVGENQVYEFKAFAGTTNITAFNKPVEISVPYILKAGETGENITVFFMNDNGELENVIGTYNAATQSVTFTTLHFSKYIIKENIVTFSDLSTAEWARSNIQTMAAKGIIAGIGGGKYAPSDNLTRAQFATLIVKAFKLEDATAENVFTDVESTKWYYSAVVSANKAGIVTGYAGKFNPDAYVTRQEMATMAARALVSVKGKDLSADSGKYLAKFTDKELLAAYAVDGANLTAKYGVIGGKNGNLFDPKGFATRAEAAAVIYRLFNIE